MEIVCELLVFVEENVSIENLCTKYQFLASCVLGDLEMIANNLCTDITELINSSLDPIWLWPKTREDARYLDSRHCAFLSLPVLEWYNFWQSSMEWRRLDYAEFQILFLKNIVHTSAG